MAPKGSMGRGYRHTCCHRIKHDCAKAKNGLYSIPVSNPTSFTVECKITEDPNQRGNEKVGILFGVLANKHMDAQLSAPIIPFRGMGSSWTIF